ncbi:MAE_28990/MAE_18760 family HEPN-like nuclease [Streptomyces sp. B1866]|uniref:MAE_28990/MAE_18760 family HEPN-like nuclease n=1 Tax=Streptomyces sp. B1866 TaxID=3075431 RepID=UPI00288E9BF7|nr:MAE_28990/MAE_18760 family HEPN-like nuclease [Streptomyces sp. B1866]MDT3395233.1 MAE_28990/MAE_18760 family HEPN-like nuclease [Streptomyces sp. B1866]
MDPSRFIEAIDRQLARRKVELSTLLLMVKDENPDPSRLNCLARSAVVLTYAHWEGFVKQGSSEYVKHVNDAKIKVSELKLPFQAAHVSSAFKRAKESEKAQYLGSLLEEIDRRRGEVFSISPEKCVDTESNLSSRVFFEIVKGIGLDVLPLYEMRRAFIDQRLVLARNGVAHGQLLSFDALDVEDRIKGTLKLIDAYADQLKDAAVKRYFMK